MTIIDRCMEVSHRLIVADDWSMPYSYTATGMANRALAFLQNMRRDGIRWEHRRYLETIERGLEHYGY